MYFLETLQIHAPCHGGVLDSFFYIDGMLFEFFMNFLNIEKKISIFHVFFAFHAISNIKKNWCKKKFRGGGTGVDFFLEKQFFLISRFMLFSTLKKNIEKCPFTYWLNWRWFLQIVVRDSLNLYPLYPLFPCSDFVSQMWGVVMFSSHFMLFTTFLEKIIWEYKTIISHLMFSSCVFLYAGNIEKCRFTYTITATG